MLSFCLHFYFYFCFFFLFVEIPNAQAKVCLASKYISKKASINMREVICQYYFQRIEMKNSLILIGFLIVSALILPNNCQKVLDNSINLFVNGDFEQPQIKQGLTWEFFEVIPGWKSSTNLFKINKGNSFNQAIPMSSGQVVQLDAHALSYNITQEIELQGGEYYFAFDATPRIGRQASCSWAVTMNYYYQMYEATAREGKSRYEMNVTTQVGTNLFEFQSWGAGDDYGIMIDNVVLHRYVEKQEPLPESPKQEHNSPKQPENLTEDPLPQSQNPEKASQEEQSQKIFQQVSEKTPEMENKSDEGDIFELRRYHYPDFFPPETFYFKPVHLNSRLKMWNHSEENKQEQQKLKQTGQVSQNIKAV